MTRIARTSLITASALLPAACSGGRGTTGSAATAPRAGSTAASPTAAGSAAGTSGADVCGYLRGRTPALRGTGSEVGATANLTTNLHSWYEERGAAPGGAVIDRQLAQECPDVATRVHELAGTTGFATP
ncbi:hypothetical protein [Umezawaea sp.]|uniref:hypothetical protein n=1 Tax=Umezawaea sp. TaxID=1955258 RepID=UPI002ED25C47